MNSPLNKIKKYLIKEHLNHYDDERNKKSILAYHLWIWINYRQHLDHGDRNLLFQISKPFCIRRHHRFFHCCKPADTLVRQWFYIGYQYSPSAARFLIPWQKLRAEDCIRNYGHVRKLITSWTLLSIKCPPYQPAASWTDVCHLSSGCRNCDPL